MEAPTPARPPGLLRNISWMMASHVLVKPAWFLFITAACIRGLGAEGYGILTTSLALAMVAQVVSDLGSGYYTVREVARVRERASLFITNILAVRLVLAVAGVGAVAGFGTALGYPPSQMSALIAAGCYVISLSLMEYVRSFFRAFEVLRNEALSVVIEKALVIGAGLGALVVSQSPAVTLSGMALGMGVALTITLVWVHRRYARFAVALLRWEVMRTTLFASLPIGLFLLFTIVLLSSGPVLVELLRGEAEAGYYGAAYRVIEAAHTLTAVVIAAVLPRLAALFYADRRAEYARLLLRSAGALSALTVVGAGILTVAGGLVIRLLAGTEGFSEAGYLLQIMGWALPFMSMTHLLMAALIAADRQRYVATSLGVCALAAVVANLVLIPQIGLYGAGAVLIGGHVLATVFGSVGLWRLLRVQPGTLIRSGESATQEVPPCPS